MNFPKMLNFSYLTVNRETKSDRRCLYLYNQNLFINLNSLIMKKTILTTMAFCMLMVTVADAKIETGNSNENGTELALKKEASIFCKAIMSGDIDRVRGLIELGENVNAKSLGMTPAIFAARYNKAEILELLIAKGANLKLKCNKGWSIAKHAKLSNAKAVLRVLKNNV